MMKRLATILVVAAAIIYCSTNQAEANGEMNVEGLAYCDPCRVEFQTSISTPISGAKVKLTCRNMENDTITFEKEGVTDSQGMYSLPVEGDHEDDICEVNPIDAGTSECNVPFKTVNSARVLLTKNVGVVSQVRSASALGFMVPTADNRCNKVLLDLGFLPQAEEVA